MRCLQRCFLSPSIADTAMLSCSQAYKYWLQGQHPFLFIVNNDVLVPSGVLTRLMDGMRDDGALTSGWASRID